MAIDLLKIHQLLNAISDETINHSQLTELVRLSRLIIQSYLINYRSNVMNLITKNGITMTDLAYDCIADVFARNREEKFYSINKFLNSLESGIKEIKPLNLFLAYKSFLIKVTNIQLSKLYSQTDPIGAKIIRNIKDSVRASDKFCISKDLSGLKLTIKSNSSNNLDCYPDFPFEKLLIEAKRNNRILNISELLIHLYNILQEEKGYKKSVYLFDVVSLFKNYFGSEYDYNFEIDEQTLISNIERNYFEEYEIQYFKQKVENFIKEKILVNYFLKGKLNKAETEAVFYSLNDIISDWCSGLVSNNSIYEYFRNHFNISHDLYLKNYRTKIEYLVKLARDEFTNYMLKEI